MDSNYHLKKQLLLDIEEATKFKELNIELMEHLTFTTKWILNYCSENNVKHPNADILLEMIQKCRTLMERMNISLPPDPKHPFKNTQRFNRTKFFILLLKRL